MMVIAAMVKVTMTADAISKWYVNWDICHSLLLFGRFYTSS